MRKLKHWANLLLDLPSSRLRVHQVSRGILVSFPRSILHREPDIVLIFIVDSDDSAFVTWGEKICIVWTGDDSDCFAEFDWSLCRLSLVPQLQLWARFWQHIWFRWSTAHLLSNN